MLLIRDSTLKRAFLCSSCWALAPVLNEFIVSTAFGDVDYSSNVGQCFQMRLLGGISTVARVLTHPVRLFFPRDCLFIGIVNDKGRSHEQSQVFLPEGTKLAPTRGIRADLPRTRNVLEAVEAHEVWELATTSDVGDSVLYRA
jgi:hypothetical protein